MSKSTMGKVEFYKDRKGQYRWRLIAHNGRTLADSGEGYVAKAACRKGFNATVRAAHWARVVDLVPRAKRVK